MIVVLARSHNIGGLGSFSFKKPLWVLIGTAGKTEPREQDEEGLGMTPRVSKTMPGASMKSLVQYFFR
jgi:hypothetical protein